MFQIHFFGHTLTKFPFQNKAKYLPHLSYQNFKGYGKDPDLTAGSNTRHNQGSEYQFRYHQIGPWTLI